MKKMKRRATLCILLALVLMVGIGFYIYKQVIHGGEWVSWTGNGDVYNNGYIDKGAIYDRSGEVLRENGAGDGGMATFNGDWTTRVATMHTVGDKNGNVNTGASLVFADKLIGYDFFNGTYSINNKGRNVYLTIDAEVCATAYRALNGRNGCVGVYNYKTGEIICMVSTPSYDPYQPPELAPDDTSGAFINKFLSATFVPGSIMKVITSTAAIENIDNLDTWTYKCTGSTKYGNTEKEKVTCLSVHGTQTFKDALANSCNCAFAELSIMLGPDTLQKYVEKAGLLSSYDIDGIKTTPSTFDFPGDDLSLAWTGIGQYHDMVNPCAMMVYMGAIANGGSTYTPTILKDVQFANGWSADLGFKPDKVDLVDPATAAELNDMLHNNVVSEYGQWSFPDLDICAKTGTAEVGSGQPHSWFTGYIRNPGYPYAFIVLVENGGTGLLTAGNVANQVMQTVLKELPSESE